MPQNGLYELSSTISTTHVTSMGESLTPRLYQTSARDVKFHSKTADDRRKSSARGPISSLMDSCTQHTFFATRRAHSAYSEICSW